NFKFPDPVATDVHTVPSNGSATISFQVVEGNGVAKDFHYTIVNLPSDDDPLNQSVRLNGLPPGEPVIGTLTLAPGGEGTVSVDVSYDPYMGIPLSEIILEADLDGDGVPEPAAVIPIRPEPGNTVDVRGQTDPEKLDKVLGYPNPFDRTTGVGFALPKGQ